MRLSRWVLAGLGVMLFSPSATFAQEARVVLRSTVVGNQEQPKVLYIVPWQSADSPQLNYQPLQNLVEDIFTPIDREQFLRQQSYRETLQQATTEQ